MNATELQQLKALAQGALNHGDAIGEDEWYSAYENMGIFAPNPDLSFIAAANPSAILGLIELAERASLPGDEGKVESIDTPEFWNLVRNAYCMSVGNTSSALIAFIGSHLAKAREEGFTAGRARCQREGVSVDTPQFHEMLRQYKQDRTMLTTEDIVSYFTTNLNYAVALETTRCQEIAGARQRGWDTRFDEEVAAAHAEGRRSALEELHPQWLKEKERADKAEAELTEVREASKYLATDANEHVSRVHVLLDKLAARQTPEIVVEIRRNRVWIVKGVQSFMLAHEADTDQELQWYAEQLRKALSSTAQPLQQPIGEIVCDPFGGSYFSKSIPWTEMEPGPVYSAPQPLQQEGGKDFESTFIDVLGNLLGAAGPIQRFNAANKARKVLAEYRAAPQSPDKLQQASAAQVETANMQCPICGVDRLKERCKQEHWQVCPMTGEAQAKEAASTTDDGQAIRGPLRDCDRQDCMAFACTLGIKREDAEAVIRMASCKGYVNGFKDNTPAQATPEPDATLVVSVPGFDVNAAWDAIGTYVHASMSYHETHLPASTLEPRRKAFDEAQASLKAIIGARTDNEVKTS